MNTKFANLKFPFWKEPKGIVKGIVCISVESEHLVSCCLAGAGELKGSQLKCRCCVRAVEMFGTFSVPEKALSNDVL